MTHTEAKELANQFGTRMCDESGETHGEELYCFDLDDIIALKEALAQPEQEPVAWIDEFGNVFPLGAQRGPKHLNEPMKPLYTAPPQPEQEPIKESSVTHSHLWIGELWRKEKNT